MQNKEIPAPMGAIQSKSKRAKFNPVRKRGFRLARDVKISIERWVTDKEAATSPRVFGPWIVQVYKYGKSGHWVWAKMQEQTLKEAMRKARLYIAISARPAVKKVIKRMKNAK